MGYTPHCHNNGLVQDCSNSSALALELPQSCPKPSLYTGNRGNKLVFSRHHFQCHQTVLSAAFSLSDCNGPPERDLLQPESVKWLAVVNTGFYGQGEWQMVHNSKTFGKNLV